MPALDGDKSQTLEKRTTISYLANSGLNGIAVMYRGNQKKKSNKCRGRGRYKSKPSNPKDKAKQIASVTTYQEV